MKRQLTIQLLYLVLLTACLVFTLLVTAQEQLKKPLLLHAGVQTAVPVSKHFAESHSVGFGPFLDAQYRFSQRLAASARVGYDYFLGKEYSFMSYEPGMEPVYNETHRFPAAHVVSLTGGVRYFAGDHLYLQGMLGLSLKNWKNASRTRPLAGGSAGYSFPLGNGRTGQAGFNFFGICEAAFMEVFFGIAL